MLFITPYRWDFCPWMSAIWMSLRQMLERETYLLRREDTEPRLVCLSGLSDITGAGISHLQHPIIDLQALCSKRSAIVKSYHEARIN
jgi:hypothetical protein